MIIRDKRLAEIATRHGVDITMVEPPDKNTRLEQLKSILGRRDVPFPIDPEYGEKYYQQALDGIPFGIGTLNDKTVDLEGYENHQEYHTMTMEDHLSWACLVADQQSTKHSYACGEYLHGEEMFEIGGTCIPDYYILNARIFQQTGWQLATVSMIIPADVFFHCHSRRFFPVTTFMRPLECDYLEEPDIGHDIAGHVATFTIPQVAEVMNNHGLANDIIRQERKQRLATARDEQEVQRIDEETQELLLYAGRLYWFTVEFGLVMQDDSLKAFGAGILSSPGETRYSVDSPHSNRVLIDPSLDKDLLRLATTDYLISEYQKTYFVMKSFATLSSLTPERILRIVHVARDLPHHTWREIVPGDNVINVGTILTSPNEKYYRLLARQPLDECLQRAAIRNLRLYAAGLDIDTGEKQMFMDALPPIPDEIHEEFRKLDEAGTWKESS